ncbi:hypothetical protein HPP92_028261 [Vanilla planifolia]|uniref:RRM domain-containing protein n=1 Tax=Vanilla planifolia TaxID=51239 RepID=A0A835U3L0_VANPL|nr:hypothetical protein HPP92_028261 [Vanilla planifolia]
MASTSSFQHRCVFVGNIPYDATIKSNLYRSHEEVGPVVSFRKPKGYGFCEYKDEETALSARRNLQGYEINGRQLRVDFAENDKGADRNREQGRGGTGLTSGTDAQKSLNGYPIGGDAVLQQPFGVPLAASAASLIAEALNGSQTSGLLQPKSNLLSVSGSGTDSLTLYLAKFSRHQLNEIITEMKALIMLGMMNPQMMQMASKSSEVAYSSVQDVHQDLKPVLPLYHGQVPSQTELVEKFLRPSEPLERNILASASVFQSSGLPSKLVPLSAHQPPLVKNQISAQGTVSVVSGDPMHLNIQARHLPSVGISLPQEQTSLLHHHRPIRISNISDHPQQPSREQMCCSHF